jgi:hypothetical protein
MLKIFLMAVIGIPFYTYVDAEGPYVPNLEKVADPKFISIAFICIVYAFGMMLLIYYFSGLKFFTSEYIDKDFYYYLPATYRMLWWISFVLTLTCFFYVIFQTNFTHPGIEALRSGYTEIKGLRKFTETNINMTVYNVSLKLLLPFNLIAALFFVRRRLFKVLSIMLFILIGTFLLKKSNMIIVIITILFFVMLFTGIKLRTFLKFVLAGTLTILFMFTLTKYSWSLSESIYLMVHRIIAGEIVDLPVYFEVFEKSKIGFSSMLPPYVSAVFGIDSGPPAAKLVMEYANPIGVARGTAGSAATFFVGEAFSVFGYFGVYFGVFIGACV